MLIEIHIDCHLPSVLIRSTQSYKYFSTPHFLFFSRLFMKEMCCTSLKEITFLPNLFLSFFSCLWYSWYCVSYYLRCLHKNNRFSHCAHAVQRDIDFFFHFHVCMFWLKIMLTFIMMQGMFPLLFGNFLKTQHAKWTC